MSYKLDIDTIKKSLDIVDVISRYLTVTKKGNRYYALCPFHNDTNPSLTISKEKNIFKCYACGEGGNVITFIQKYEHIPFKEALFKAAEMAGIDTNQYKNNFESANKEYYKCLKDLSDYYSLAIELANGEKAKKYCESRGLNEEIRKRFHIGYAPLNGEETIKYLRGCDNPMEVIDNLGLCNIVNGERVDLNKGRLVFPITDINDNIVAFSCRRLEDDDSPKYVNSKETIIFKKSNVLYNYAFAKDFARKEGHIYILEGFMDVIALYKIGIKNAVGLMGTALTNDHIKLLKNLNVEVRLCLDNDNAGQKAEATIIKEFEKQGINYRIVKLSKLAKDCDEILNIHGEEKLKEFVNTLVTKQEFILNYYSQGYDLTDDTERKKFVYDIIDKISNIKDQLDIEEYAEKIAKISGFSKTTIMNLLNDKRDKQAKIEEANTISASYYVSEANTPIKEAIEKANKNKRIGNLEGELLYHMLKSKMAIDYFNSYVQYFSNPIYSEIALYLQDYEELNKEVSSDNLIDFVSQNVNAVNNDMIINAITSIDNDEKYHYPLTKKTLEDLCNNLNKERTLYQKNSEIESKLKKELDDNEKAELLSKIAQLKKQTNKK